MAQTLITSIRPWGGALSDVLVEDGRISAVRPAAEVAPSGEAAVTVETVESVETVETVESVETVDGRGYIAVPSFSDVHAHLDSTLLGLPFRPHTAGPGLTGLIENDRANWRDAGATVAERATYTLGATIASGTTTVRSHAQVDADAGLERLEGVVAAREAHSGRATVQIVAFPQSGIVRDRGTADLLDAAMTQGADLVGGIDPCGLDRDPVEHLDIVFAIAERHRAGIDIHLHEAGELGAFTLELVFERIRALGMQGLVTISHAFALPTAAPDRLARLVDDIVELDVALTTVAPGGQRHLPMDALATRGVRVGLGQDGIRDYWSPYGDGDMLGRTWQLAFVNQYRRDELIERCVALATLGGRSVVDRGLAAAWTDSTGARGFAPGDPADLLLVAGDTVTAAVMDRPAQRIVLRGARPVAVDGVLV